jgi:cell fate regulator YaaT (PSP1 superfamily)
MKEQIMDTDKPKKDKSYLPRSWGGYSRREQPSSDCPPMEVQNQPAEVMTEAAVERPIESDPGCECQDVAETRENLQEEDEDYSDQAVSDMEDDPQDWVSSEALDLRDTVGEPAESQVVRIPVNIVGIRFGYACKVYHFDSSDMDLAAGDWVIVKTEKGMGLGQVAIPPFKRELDTSQLEGLRKVIRKAGKTDFDQKARCTQREAEAFAYCLERIDALELPMKLVAVECFFDGSKYVFYFTAEGRVDFRELVKQLVARFPVRIEMRQIGVRHEAKMTGGLACCGQELCCSRFLVDFRPVSVKMAKNQNLSLNPTKISGVCGRLMCCLGYEHDIYEDFKKGLPRVGKMVNTSKGEGVVLKHNPLAETVFVRLDEENIIEVRKDEIIPGVESAPQKKPSKKTGSSKAKNNASDKKSGEEQPPDPA